MLLYITAILYFLYLIHTAVDCTGLLGDVRWSACKFAQLAVLCAYPFFCTALLNMFAKFFVSALEAPSLLHNPHMLYGVVIVAIAVIAFVHLVSIIIVIAALFLA